MYRPTMSHTFSTNIGSVESLNVSCRCGCSPNARQMRRIAFWVMPISRAISRALQRVAPTGMDFSVLATTASTRSSSMVRGAPERGASSRPSRRCFTNRPRHLETVCFVTPSCSVTALFSSPSAHASTMRNSPTNFYIRRGRTRTCPCALARAPIRPPRCWQCKRRCTGRFPGQYWLGAASHRR